MRHSADQEKPADQKKPIDREKPVDQGEAVPEQQIRNSRPPNPSDPPPARKHPKEFASSDQAGDFEVRISIISSHWNDVLTRFFGATAERTRLYWLLASLARHQSVRTANAMAFDFFLALVPMLGLAGWTASVTLRGSELDGFSTRALLRELTPTQIDNFIGQQFQAMAASHLAPFAAFAGWWLVSSAFNTMIDVFEESFACVPRNWIHTRLISLAFALVAMIFVGLFFGFGVILALAPAPIVQPILASLRYFGLIQASVALGSLAGATAFLALLYRYSLRRPDRKRRVFPGALTATLLGSLATAALGYYATNIARYALFYGGLAAIVVVLLWLWLWSTAILIGAEINIALEDVVYAKNLGSDPVLGSDIHLVASEPFDEPIHTPRSLGNSGGD